MQMEDLSIENEENKELVFDEGVEEDCNRFDLCIVGRFLTEKNINGRAMRTKLADLWKPAMGINIKDLKPGISLFQFYHRDDMNWVLSNRPWMFDGALPVMNIVRMGEDAVQVSLNEVDFWIHIHELLVGYMTEMVGKQLGTFFGTFLQYDAKNNSSIWREFMRLRIRVDVCRPLKRKKKIVKKDKTEIVVNCKYEKLGDFCFICGLFSHTERFCKKKVEITDGDITKEWGHWLHAQPRKIAGGSKSKWLREEGDGDWGRRKRMDNYNTENQGFQKTDWSRSPIDLHDQRNKGNNSAKNQGYSGEYGSNVTAKAGNSNSSNTNGLDADELYGLNLEERKRQRKEAQYTVLQTQQTDTTIKEPTLSNGDCAGTFPILMTKLATQASQQQ